MSLGEFMGIALLFFTTGLVYGINISSLIRIRKGK